MAMEAFRASLPASTPSISSDILHVHRSGNAGAAGYSRSKDEGILLNGGFSLQRRCDSASGRCSWSMKRLWGRAGSEGRREVVGEDVKDGGLGFASCLEVAEDGSRYLHVMASSMHNVDNGSIIGLTCVPITKGHSSSIWNLEFPLFINALAATPIKIAVEKGGLPHALEELGNLNDLDLQKIYVNSLSDVRKGGDFLVLDERTGVKCMVASTFPQAIAVALWYRQPFFLKRETLLSANRDFIDRMLINPLARDQDGDVEWLAELSKSMHVIVENQARLQTALKCSVNSEQYDRALQLKQELFAYDMQMDDEAVKVLERLRALYLERMGIFFKL